QACQSILDLVEKIRAAAGKQKRNFVQKEKDAELAARVHELGHDKLRQAVQIKVKQERYATIAEVEKQLGETLVAEGTVDLDEAKKKERAKEINGAVHDLHKKVVRQMTVDEGFRIDGRRHDEIRAISCEVGLIPRTHGSSLFTRGETQALVSTTLGTAQDVQRIDSLMGDVTKRFMLHYTFPPFSTGEAKMMRSASRREIGHGHLAERALARILPAFEDFPYTIRVVSEILESNGSSSMASVCGGCLSLMDAG